MVRYCDKLNCNKDSKATKGISFHEIPCDPILRSQWLNLSNANSGFREGTFKLKTGRNYDNTFICQAHFEDTCYEPNKRKLSLLRYRQNFILFQMLFANQQQVENRVENERRNFELWKWWTLHRK